MSQQTKSLAFNDCQNTNENSSQDSLSRTEMIRDKWNNSVRKCRAQKAKLMQMRLAALILAQPNAA